MNTIVSLLNCQQVQLQAKSAMLTPPTGAPPMTIIVLEMAFGTGSLQLQLPEQLATAIASKIRELENKLVTPNAKN